MKYPRYQRYKDSGAEWLGEVPEGWEVICLRRLCRLNPSKSEVALSLDSKVTFLPMEAVGADGSIAPQAKILEEVYSGYTYFCDNDIIVAKITPCFENGKCALLQGLINGIGFGSTEFHVVRARSKAFSRFLLCVFKMESFRNFGEPEMTGAAGQKRLPEQFILNFLLPIPTIPEQQIIATFLDHNCAKIDALIAEQEKLIALLREKRQAAISHAVTKGLNPDVPMKDSGVEWLGNVPKGWEVTHLKYVTNCIVDCPHETPTYSEDGDYFIIRTADISAGRLDISRIYRLDASEYEYRIRRRSLCKGDIVYGREGERWGFAAVVPEDGLFCLGQRMMQFSPSKEIYPYFLMWQLNSQAVYQQGAVDVVGATSPHVNVWTIRNYFLALPPLSEQQTIVAYLDTETARIDTLISESEKAVTLLKERRSALISAAVTGKIDVRNIPLQEVV